MKDIADALSRGFNLAAEELARFETEAAALLRDPSLPPVHKRDLRDRIEAVAERVLRHGASLREAAAQEGGLGEGAAERIDRLFLAELEASLEEGFRFMERRLGRRQGPGQASPTPAQADRSLRGLEGEYAPSPASLDSLGAVARRADFLAARAARARDEGERRLERELQEVKRKSFLALAELAGALNPELLFKCRLALETRLKGGSPLRLGAEALDEGSIAAWPGPGGALDAELFERGLRLRLLFRPAPEPGPPAGEVGGWVESGGERAEFGLQDPRRPLGSAAPRAMRAEDSFRDFLASFDLAALYGELSERLARLRAAAEGREGEESPAARLSAALDDLL